MSKIDLIIEALLLAKDYTPYKLIHFDALEAARELKKKQECETCASKRKRLMDAGFLKSPLRGEDHVD